MTIRTALTHYEVVSNIEFSNGSEKLPLDLKCKILEFRVNLFDVRKNFDLKSQEIAGTYSTPAIITIAKKAKEERTDDEKELLATAEEKINEELNNILDSELENDIEIMSLTPEEWKQIIKTNSDKSVKVNDIILDPALYMEALWSFYVVRLN